MLLLLIRKELLEHLLSLRFALACILCLLVSVSSSIVRIQDYGAAVVANRNNVAMHRIAVEEAQLWEVRNSGINVDKPVNPLQIFFQGLESGWATTVRVFYHAFPQYSADYEGNPVRHLFPPVDLFFFVGVIMSLLALAFSYDAVSGEKEQNTLKLLMSYSVPRDQILLAKWLGGYVTLVAPLLIALMSGLLVLVLSPNLDFDAEDLFALLMVFIVSLLYLAALYSLGILVSTRTRQASTAITTLLMVWAVIVLVIPNVAPYLAAQLSPVRTANDVTKEKLLIAIEERQKHDEETEQWREDNPQVHWTRRWQVWHTLKGESLLRQQEGERKINEQFHFQLQAQVNLGQILSRVSPLASFTYAGTDLAGTGIRDRSRFRDLIPQYRRDMTEFGAAAMADASLNQRWRQARLIDYPEFVYEESDISDRINWLDILLLAVWSLVFYMAAHLSFLRYDVT